MAKTKPFRAVGYCRTSGEGQRDNTSIPTQKQFIEECCERNGWRLSRFYADECKSGAKVAGRDDFQQMLEDAANGKFDVVVPYDISRLARDGEDIMENAKFLKVNFGIYVVDCKGQFDNRSARNALQNFVHAGVSEHERLSIMERTILGRIRTAKEGKPWSSHPPIGRAYDEKTGRWFVTDKGRAIAEVLQRYIEGEKLEALCSELGISRSAKISEWVWHGQLAGTYKARFHSPEIEIEEEVPVPGIPDVVTLALLNKTQARLRHNRTYNRHDTRSYVLTGFIRCGDCGKALSGQPGSGKTIYYRHKASDGCSVKGVRGDEVEPAVLDHLYNFFLDEPNFNAAVERAMPSADHRQGLVNDRTQTAKRLAENDREIARLVDAIAHGADVRLLVSKQDKLKAEKEALTQRLEQLETEIATLPSAERMETAAMLMRLRLVEEHTSKDWQALPYEDVKRFLFHLFGETTVESGTGMFVRRDRGKLVVTFRGQVDFHHRVVDGRAISEVMRKEAARMNAKIRMEFDRAVQAADEEHRMALEELKPSSVKQSPGATRPISPLVDKPAYLVSNQDWSL